MAKDTAAVQATGTFATGIGGHTRMVRKGQVFDASHPIVQANPTRFGGIKVQGDSPSAASLAARAEAAKPAAARAVDAAHTPQGLQAGEGDNDPGTPQSTTGKALEAAGVTPQDPDAVAVGGLSDEAKARSEAKADRAAAGALTTAVSSGGQTAADDGKPDAQVASADDLENGYTRTQLNDIATALGVADADTLANKAEVAAAIVKARK